jgi:hypothetical protein
MTKAGGSSPPVDPPRNPGNERVIENHDET